MEARRNCSLPPKKHPSFEELPRATTSVLPSAERTKARICCESKLVNGCAVPPSTGCRRRLKWFEDSTEIRAFESAVQPICPYKCRSSQRTFPPASSRFTPCCHWSAAFLS